MEFINFFSEYSRNLTFIRHPSGDQAYIFHLENVKLFFILQFFFFKEWFAVDKHNNLSDTIFLFTMKLQVN